MGAGLPGVEFKEELFIQESELSLSGDFQELCGHEVENPQVSKAMLGKGFHEGIRHEMWDRGLLQGMVEISHEVLFGEGLEDESGSYPGSQGDQLPCAQSFGKPLIATQNGGEDALGVEMGAGEEPDLIEAGGYHLLSLIDEEHGSKKGGLDMMQPPVSQGFEASVAVGRREIDPEDGAKLPVKVAKAALGSFHDANANILKGGEPVGDELQDLGFSQTRLCADQGKTAFHDQVLQSEGERLEGWRGPEGFNGNV
jgi:hypothetical protein